VADVYPQRIPDLFSAKPVVVTGRYTGPGRATIRLKGKMAGNDFVREIPVELPETMASHDVLASLWARARVDDLMGQDFQGLQSGNIRADLQDTITQLGIEYRLMTQFTSFVAVEEIIVTDGGQPRRIDVPVESPEGVESDKFMEMRPTGALQSYNKQALRSVSAIGGYILSGPVGGQPISGGVVGGGGSGRRSRAKAAPTPPPAMVNSPPMVSSITVTDGGQPVETSAPVKSADDQRREELQPKLHRSVLAVVMKLRKNETLTTADEARFIRNGKAEVQVWLTEKSDDTVAKLKELGFEVLLDVKTSKLIIGRISIDKLETLAELKFVSYISPQVSK